MEKLLEYLPFSQNELIKYGIILFIGLLLIYLYFDKTFEYFKDNLRKWDTVTFLRYTCLMIIPIIALISLNFNFLSDKHLNDWIHSITLLFILPFIPYTFLVFYRFIYLGIRKIIKFIKRKIKRKEVELT